MKSVVTKRLAALPRSDGGCDLALMGQHSMMVAPLTARDAVRLACSLLRMCFVRWVFRGAR